MGKQTKPLSVISQVEHYLWEYKGMKKELRQIRSDIYLGVPYFENIGASRSNAISDVTALKATLLSDHKAINFMQQWIDAIESEFEKLPPEKQKLIEKRYWERGRNCPNWDVLAEYVHVHKDTAIQWRNRFCRDVARQIGLK